ncbi:hypothetical protein M4R22_09255 [Acidovorax sp. GBBC 3334]|uniref:hypothetical protein n=1 Tax=Acidovorax sp. GBBC 3334 TaxID=2940496 RepID=UPI0023028B63|nr:hypothetical protein [Acidovorax sp. GBBC 3334]MDA8454949.1 hypothetical protein [Acidovorax sp. GBBC 3334]
MATTPSTLPSVDSTRLSALVQTAAQQGLLAAWSDYLQDVRTSLAQGAPAPIITLAQVQALAEADPALADRVNGAVQGGAGPAATGRAAAAVPATPPATRSLLAPSDFLEGNGQSVDRLSGLAFQNWGRTVSSMPGVTCFPKTRAGVQAIVQWAAANGRSVRCAGYRHTWTSLYAEDGEVLVSLLPLSVATQLPASEPPIDPTNELQGIAITGYVQDQGMRKALCRIGAATTNEQFRQWCLSAQGGQWDWTLPLNVIMVEITFGGSNAPVCHGAGWGNQTLSDLVAEIEFVNARGELQTVSDPALLRSAAGAFGLLGVVTALTLKLDPMSYAVLAPRRERLALSVPPPEGFAVPPQVDMSGITPQDLAAARADFVSRCETDYYAEWFWFTFQPDCWINTWKNGGRREDAVDYPSPLETRAQELQEYLAGLLIDTPLFQALPQDMQAKLLGDSAMAFLPTEGATTPLIDGLHFRRGIQNMRVLDMEFEIPIPERADQPGQPDWNLCQRAWWDAIAVIYGVFASQGIAPMRLTLEMRIMGGSGITLAPQRGNDLGTCSIELLTTLNTDPGEWAQLMQQITDAWAHYTDAQGRPLNIRPHWAKQWQGLSLRGQPIEDHLRTVAYAGQWPVFGQDLAAIASAGGYTVADMRQRFSNPLIDRVFAPAFQAPAP